jgi:flagellin
MVRLSRCKIMKESSGLMKEVDKVRIRNNVPALSAWRNMTQNDAQLEKSIGRLSSGLRINHAGDDASGLAMSEKMRAIIKGLNQAERNAQDGISLVQTADQGMAEIQVVLQRVRELSVQAGNATLTPDARLMIQGEVDQLASEITRLATSTFFNGRELLNGSITRGAEGEIGFQVGAQAGQKITVGIDAVDSVSLGIGRDLLSGTLATTNAVTSIDAVGPGLNAGNYTVSFNPPALQLLDASSNPIGPVVIPAAGETVTIGNPETADTLEVTAANPLPGGAVTDAATLAPTPGREALKANFNGSQKLNEAQCYAGIKVCSVAAAAEALTRLDTAIAQVGQARSRMGAAQNRLESATAGLQITSENMVAAESRIRDIDLAHETMAMAKRQMLAQSSTAMLAQANSKPQSVLELLKQ